MKTLTLILAFLPLNVFSVLARFLPHSYIGVAGLAAAVLALVAIVTSHPVWPPKIGYHRSSKCSRTAIPTSVMEIVHLAWIRCVPGRGGPRNGPNT